MGLEGPAYFASLTARQLLPTARVEYALRGDDALNEGDVRDLMQAYIAVRNRRLRDNGSTPNSAQATAPAAASGEAGSEEVGVAGVRRGA